MEGHKRDPLCGRRSDTGRRGLSGDQVLRIALLKQIHGLSYRELEFHLQDSDSFRTFVGLGFEERPSFQALQTNVKQIRPGTWEAIHRTLMGFARDAGVERGEKIRGDRTTASRTWTWSWATATCAAVTTRSSCRIRA